MRLVTPLSLGALWACSGGDDPTGTTEAGSCDGIATSPLAEVSSEAWPDGTAEAIETYRTVDGRYETTNSCGYPTAIKLTTHIAGEEALQLVTEPWPVSRDCGCLTDPNFAPDSKYGLVALHDEFQFFVETFDDPGVQGQTLVGDGALFTPGEPMRFRGCATTNIDPLLESRYEQLTTIFRIELGGTLSADLVLATPEGEVEVCSLSGFVKIE